MYPRIMIQLLEPVPIDTGNGLEMLPAGTNVVAVTVDNRHVYEDLIAEGRAKEVPLPVFPD
jgi:hypothetical protein